MIIQETLENKIEVMVSEIIADDADLFLVKVVLKGNVGNQKLIILLDGDSGVNIDQCSKVSRKLAAILEEKEFFSDKYFLEVSSAGLDFPLQLNRQYEKNIGRSLKVDLKNGDSIKGELKEVSAEMIKIEEVVKKVTTLRDVHFNEINKSMVLVSFK